MIQHIPSLQKLVHEIGRLPGIGPKTALRLAFFVLRSKNELAQNLSTALLAAKAQIHECAQCFAYTEGSDLCHYCQSPHRSDETICVIESPSDITNIESSGAFRGRYHVLHGSIAPLEGVTPNDLRIQPLMDRIDQAQAEGSPLKEIILALDADLEGDTTALYLSKLIRQRQLKVSRIAHGVPIGGDIDYIDERTIGRALQNRVDI